MDTKQIILGAVILVILVVLYFWIFSDNSQVNLLTLAKANVTQILAAKSVPNSYEFTWSFWVHMNDYVQAYGKKKYILFRKPASEQKGEDKHTIAMYLNPFQSDLTVSLHTQTKDNPEKRSTCTVPNIPLQKWTNVLVSYRNRGLDIYIDGKLTKTCVLASNLTLPKESQEVLMFPSLDKINGSGGDGSEQGFSGFLGTLRYYTRSVQPREAYAIYKEGYSGGNWLSDLFNKYKLKIAFLEDNKEINSFLL